MRETVFPLKSKKMPRKYLGGHIHYSTIYCAKTLLTFHSLLSGCKNKRKFPAADCCSFAMREFIIYVNISLQLTEHLAPSLQNPFAGFCSAYLQLKSLQEYSV
jgi:hypothetical protein